MNTGMIAYLYEQNEQRKDQELRERAKQGDVDSPYYEYYRDLGMTPESKNLRVIYKKLSKLSAANKAAIDYIDQVENPCEDLLVVRSLLTLD